jgi:hypothetical protein
MEERKSDEQPAAEDHQPLAVTGEEDPGGDIPAEAVFSPDDPIAKEEGEIPLDAIYFPDDPIIVNKVVDGVVTGMAGDPHPGKTTEGDLTWQIQHAAHIMNALSKALKEQGLEALKVHPETEPIDAVLRSFVAGYLIGKSDPR